MFSIEKCSVPASAMLARYSVDGAYTDCYLTEITGHVSLTEFMIAFYTTVLFRLERLILSLAVARPSNDLEVRLFADRTIDHFAAWHVEDRRENEILLCDFVGRTRSWLMTVPTNTMAGDRTQLYFGSAVVPKRNSRTGKLSLGFEFRTLLGFHQIYSVLLLYSAKLKIQSKQENSSPRQKEI